jgi:diguanylate cyclase (GGDEF)-like protein
MHAQADTQRAELRLAFLRHLPKRAEAIGRRGRRFCKDGWDINGLSLLHDDVQRLAGVSGRYGVLEVSEHLLALETLLGRFLGEQTLPDAAANEKIVQLLDDLAPAVPSAPSPSPGSGAAARHASVRLVDSPRVELAPANYWRRWTEDAPPPQFPDAPPEDFAPVAPVITSLGAHASRGDDEGERLEAAGPVDEAEPATRAPAAPRPAVLGRVAPITKVVAAAPQPAPAVPQKPHHRLYHLTDSSPLAVELDQRLEALGYELELIDSGDELKEILTALAPDIVIVDAAYVGELEGIGAALRSTRERSGARIGLLVVSHEDSVPVRLAARRAGANALLIKPGSVEDVLAKLQEVLAGGAQSDKYRILVVEDDRSQALFAESILRNAGMEAQVVTDAFEVLDAMETFKPDLVLMDLYMPQCDGTELTALIREREEFLNTPIVFLSGESDQDKHYEALSVGGDDFLSKPIRPKYLIASVTNRVQRARVLRNRTAAPNPRDPATGLFHRHHLLDRLNDALGAENARERDGGVLFLEIDGVATLRERLGLSGVEQVLGDAAAFLVQQLDAPELASRYGDGCLVVFSPERDDAALEARASTLRTLLLAHGFSVAGQPLRIRVSVGSCALRHGFADAGALLNAAERASREARGRERGVHRYEPPKRADDELAQALLGEIRNAIEHDGFELLYQPIVALQGGEEAQYQTLLRLRDEQGRLFTAAQIVPLALSANLILEVDRWVLTHALRVLEQRRAEHRPVRLFVSQSAASLTASGQAGWLMSQLQARRVEGSSLVVELVVDDVSSRIEAIKDFCATLQPHGVRFCLSRFEKGLEADSVLEQLPVDYVKLATRYLAAGHTPALRDELRVIVERAHRRGLSVIAQRVEDAQAAATLWMSGIDYIQGNLVQLAEQDLEFDFQTAVL